MMFNKAKYIFIINKKVYLGILCTLCNLKSLKIHLLCTMCYKCGNILLGGAYFVPYFEDVALQSLKVFLLIGPTS